MWSKCGTREGGVMVEQKSGARWREVDFSWEEVGV